MSSQDPPIPYPLNPIYNPNDWIPQSSTVIDIAYLDAHYLKYSTAQGLENLQSINVNGTSTFFDIAQFQDQVQIVDSTASGISTIALGMRQLNSGNRIGVTLNCGNGAYNPIVLNGDNAIIHGDIINTATTLNIVPWSATSCGLRFTENAWMIGAGGTSANPSHRINGNTSSLTITSPTFRVDGNMTLIGSTGATRQITASYLNFGDVTANLTGTQMYQTTTTMIFDNNYTAGGKFGYFVNDSFGTQVQLVEMSETNLLSNRNIKLASGTGIIFGDNTTQTTAYTTSQLKVKTFTITTNQTAYAIPTGVYKVDMKVIGRGGQAGTISGSNWGGSGAGGQMVTISNSPLSDSYGFNFSFVATAGTVIGYTQVSDNFTNAIIAKAYNGGNGTNATPTTVGTGGVISPLSGATLPTANSNYGTATIYNGSNGANGQIGSPPLTNGIAFGNPPTSFVNYGNGQFDQFSTWANGAIILTMYYV